MINVSETVSHDFHLCDQEFSVKVSEVQIFCSASFLILMSPLPVLYPFFSDKIYPLGEQDISLIRFFRILRVHLNCIGSVRTATENDFLLEHIIGSALTRVHNDT